MEDLPYLVMLVVYLLALIFVSIEIEKERRGKPWTVGQIALAVFAPIAAAIVAAIAMAFAVIVIFIVLCVLAFGGPK